MNRSAAAAVRFFARTAAMWGFSILFAKPSPRGDALVTVRLRSGYVRSRQSKPLRRLLLAAAPQRAEDRVGDALDDAHEEGDERAAEPDDDHRGNGSHDDARGDITGVVRADEHPSNRDQYRHEEKRDPNRKVEGE